MTAPSAADLAAALAGVLPARAAALRDETARVGRVRDALGPSGLTEVAYLALHRLAQAGPDGCRVREVLAATGASSGYVTRAVDLLITHGLATRARDSGDRRGVTVAATPAGAARLLRLAPAYLAALEPPAMTP